MTAVLVTPAFIPTQPDNGDTTKFGPNAWVAPRVFGAGALGDVLYRNTAVSTGASWLTAAAGVLSWSGAGVAPTITLTPTLTGTNFTGIPAAGIGSGTLADARIGASSVTQHQAALTVLETQITDGSLLARLAAAETVTGAWTFSNNVGIGTAPAAPLHIEVGNGEAWRVSLSAGTNTGYGTFRNTGGVSVIGIENSIGGQLITGAEPYAFALVSATGRKLQLSSGGGAVALTVHTNNNVGIGTASPGTQLTVVGTGSRLLRLGDGTGTVSKYALFDNASSSTYIGSEGTVPGGTFTGTLASSVFLINGNANALHLGTNGAVNLTVLSGGNVGIGTADPQAKLDVTGSVKASGSVTSASGIGYATGAGAGGTVTQLTSKATGVTLNTVTGEITMHAAALAADTTVSFTLTDSAIASGDHVLFGVSGGTAAAYSVPNKVGAAGSVVVDVRNVTLGSLSEAPVIKFSVLKSSTS